MHCSIAAFAQAGHAIGLSPARGPSSGRAPLLLAGAVEAVVVPEPSERGLGAVHRTSMLSAPELSGPLSGNVFCGLYGITNPDELGKKTTPRHGADA